MFPKRFSDLRWFLLRRIFVLLLTLVAAVPPCFSHFLPSPALPPSKEAEDLTQALAGLAARYQQGDPAERSQLLGDISGVAAQRQRLLASLIENNPGEVLRLALPDGMRAGVPTEARNALEQRLEIEGELQILHVDYKDPKQSHYVYLLKTDFGERYSLHFANQPPDVLSGARVRANGLLLRGVKARDAGDTEGAVALGDDNTGVQLLAAGGSGNTATTSSSTTSVLPNTLGAQKTLVILVNFQDNPIQPYTVADAQNVVFGTVSNFFMENSYQQTWLSGDVVGWFAIASSSTVCDANTIATQAQAAASASGVNLTAYARQVYAFPQNNACGWAGLSGVGGSPSQSWINGSLAVRVVAHELGHSLGLWHSHSLNCGTATLGTNCSTVEYGDVVDTMGGPIGFSPAAHFTVFQKERLGWLNAGASPVITTVQTDGAYTLETYENVGSGPKALKILKSTDPSTGKRTWYYVEFRQPIGFDAFLATNSYVASNTNIPNGVLLHIGTESNGNSSDMLDLRPDTSNWWDPALVVGQSFDDSDAGVTITTDSVTGTGSAVTVRFGAGGPISTNQPIVAVSTDQSSYTVGQTVSMTATVSSGSAPVANASVSFTVTKSNGAVVTGTATTGSNGAAVYKLRLRKQDPVGTYQAATVATTNGMSASAATSFTVR